MMPDLIRLALALIACSALAACGDSGSFVPANGPFNGQLQVDGDPLGQLSFTYTDGLVGGTAMLTIEGNLIPVSVSAVLRGKQIDGTIRNETLGGGTFTGQFTGTTTAAGSFTFVDSAETQNLSGTWTARTGS